MPVRSWLRLWGYAAVLVLVLVAVFAIGRYTLSRQPAAHASQAAALAPTFGGVTVSASGSSLSAEETTLPTGQPAALRLPVSGPDGRPVPCYRVIGDHLIRLSVVRRDPSVYALSPSLSADGTWNAAVTLAEAGSWRLLSDFTALDDQGRPTALLLNVDLSASGPYTPQPARSDAPVSKIAGSTAILAGTARPGQAEPLLATIRQHGQPVADLGAGACLSVLRYGDLASTSAAADGDTRHGVLRFWVAVPNPGRYRAFVDFSTGGVAHTAAFTLTTS